MRTSKSVVRAAGALAVPLLLAGALGAGPARAGTAGCQSWTGVQPASPGTQNDLSGVTVLSACNVWTAGSFSDAQGVERTLIEHWNGASWTVVPSPDPGTAHNFLLSVRAESPASIWAVGAFDNGGAAPAAKTLILHWDGAHWTQQGTPVPGLLRGVRPVSGSEAWAVGSVFTGGFDRPVVLHLTGGRWRHVSVPSVAANEVVASVAGTSPRDVWAVGDAFNGTDARPAGGPPGAAQAPVIQPLVLHWNGRTWTHVKSPGTGELNSVGVASPASALAVGDQQQPDGSFHTLALRWNGRAWNTVPSASPEPPGLKTFDILTGVTVISPRSAWAVGKVQTVDGDRALIERWDGSRWTTVPAPSGRDLASIAASSAGSVWAVGRADSTTIPGGTVALALHCC